MSNWKSYKNGNYIVKINLANGTKIRYTKDGIMIPEYPESMDITITNQCNNECEFCFVSSTKVLMSDFKYKNIEDVKIGDEVIGFEEYSSGIAGVRRKMIKTKVTNTFVHVESELLEIETENGNSVTCTPNHPFLSEGSGKNHSHLFNKIERIPVGDYLFCTDFPLESNIDYDSIDYKMGYIIGSWLGDGTICHNVFKGVDQYFCRFVTKDKEINERVYRFTNFLTNNLFYYNNYKLSNTGNIVKSVVNASKKGYNILKEFINNNVGINNSKEYSCGFLSGIYDSEGSILKKNNGRVIRISNTDLSIIKEIERCLRIINIEYCVEHQEGKQGRKDIFNVRIKGFLQRDNFLWYTRPVCKRKSFESNVMYGTKYKRDALKSKKEINKKQYVYNLETECHTYIANNLLVHNCYMGCTKNGKHGDIMNAKFIDTLLPYTEIAINGNSMNHPDLTKFLEKLKSKNLIANITLNQKDFMNNLDILRYYRDNNLIYGIGISLVSPTDEFIEYIKEFPNSVIHVVNGIVRKEMLEKLYNKGLKILILGYKDVGFGKYYYKEFSDGVDNLKEEMYNNLENMMDKFDVISFDNLALEQLKVKRLLSDKEWDEFFMGDDGHEEFTSASMYVDLVNNTFSYNSMDSEKFQLMDDIKDMFNFLMKKKTKKVTEIA